MPSAAPLPPIRLTPAPMTGITPIPGLLSPVPGTLTAPSPTTLSAAAGQQVAGGRGRTGFIIAGAAVVAIAGGAIALLATKKSSGGSDDAKGSASTVVSMNNATTTHVTAPPPPVIDAAVVPPPVIDAAVPAHTGSAGSGAGSDMTVKPPAKVKVTITSTPEGAEIYFGGVDQHIKTNMTIEVPRSKVPALITLKLHGYQDVSIKDLKGETGDELTRAVKLVRVSTPTHTPSGHGSAAPTRTCDDCLLRPE
jgi:hypothetical protein